MEFIRFSKDINIVPLLFFLAIFVAGCRTNSSLIPKQKSGEKGSTREISTVESEGEASVESKSNTETFDKGLRNLAEDILIQLPKGKTQRIAVFSFTSMDGSEAECGRLLAETLETELVRLMAGKEDMSLVDRRSIEKIMEEIKFGNSDLADETQRLEIGRQLGATSLLCTVVCPWTAEQIRAVSKLIDAESTKIMAASSCNIPLPEHLKGVCALAIEASEAQEAAPVGWARQNPIVGKELHMEWVDITAGTYSMGSEEGERDERPLRPAEVAGFRISRTETTSAQYALCVGAGVCERPILDSALEHCNWGRRSRLDHPMNCVTWQQAQTFCEWVSGRLPYEVEWEYASKGGKDQKYPWGDETATCSWAVMDEGGPGCGTFTTMPVCSREAGNTDQGLCDVAGSLWEWTLDLYRTKSSVRQQGDGKPKSPQGRAPRVLRGGSWKNGADALRCANRISELPDATSEYIGFRCLQKPNQ